MTNRIANFDVPPAASGTGLLALDVVCTSDSETPPLCYAGGSCGNVLTILSYLKWNSYPVSRLTPGLAAQHVISDLERWKVHCSFIDLQDDGSTPIIIHRIGRRASGQPYHSFSWRCPACGAHLPGYKPVLATVAQKVAQQIPPSQVFFLDRVSRGAIQLAKHMSDRGAVIVFEPSGISDSTLFREAWSLSHIVKYSHDRLRELADLDLKQSEREAPLLEIETLGPDGLRYRSRLPHTKTKKWTTVAPFAVTHLQDAAGSGDWCTAGLLNKLARRGSQGLIKVHPETLREAFRYSQALAAWNCGFEGARGGMYKIDFEVFQCQVNQILDAGDSPMPTLDQANPALDRLLGHLCPSCNESSVNLHRVANVAG